MPTASRSAPPRRGPGACGKALRPHVLLEFLQGQAFPLPVNHGMTIRADDNKILEAHDSTLSKSSKRLCVVHLGVPASPLSVGFLKVEPASLDLAKQPAPVLASKTGDFGQSEL